MVFVSDPRTRIEPMNALIEAGDGILNQNDADSFARMSQGENEQSKKTDID
jgi:hypothetical protein